MKGRKKMSTSNLRYLRETGGKEEKMMKIPLGRKAGKTSESYMLKEKKKKIMRNK